MGTERERKDRPRPDQANAAETSDSREAAGAKSAEGRIGTGLERPAPKSEEVLESGVQYVMATGFWGTDAEGAGLTEHMLRGKR